MYHLKNSNQNIFERTTMTEQLIGTAVVLGGLAGAYIGINSHVNQSHKIAQLEDQNSKVQEIRDGLEAQNAYGIASKYVINYKTTTYYTLMVTVLLTNMLTI